jgi:hypothetical protein
VTGRGGGVGLKFVERFATTESSLKRRHCGNVFLRTPGNALRVVESNIVLPFGRLLALFRKMGLPIPSKDAKMLFWINQRAAYQIRVQHDSSEGLRALGG